MLQRLTFLIAAALSVMVMLHHCNAFEDQRELQPSGDAADLYRLLRVLLEEYQADENQINRKSRLETRWIPYGPQRRWIPYGPQRRESYN